MAAASQADPTRAGRSACPSDDALLRWIEGQLAADAEHGLEQHIDLCPACAEVAASLGALVTEGARQLGRYRLDERIGNLVMMTPMLDTLRARLPRANIDLLVFRRARPLLGSHPAVRSIIEFDKRRLCAPLRIVQQTDVRRSRLAIEIRRKRVDAQMQDRVPLPNSRTNLALDGCSIGKVVLVQKPRLLCLAQ